MNRYVKISMIVIFTAVCGIIYSCNIPASEDRKDVVKETIGIETMAQTVTDASDIIYVYICGEVAKPGVYEMKQGSRLYELIEEAGGFTDSAALDSLNLAEELCDTQMVTVWSVDDMMTAAVTLPAYNDGLVNINTAGIEELVSLPGIGDVRAQDIVAYRQENGSFTAIEDIMNVPGIKESVYKKIRKLITVG